MARIKVQSILSTVIDMIMASAKASHPNEFACALRAEDGIITEVLLIPGTLAGNRSAILRLHMLPIDFSIVGTAHSHPGPSSMASEADLNLFARHGTVHIIARYPYEKDCWTAYDKDGAEISLDVV